MEHVEHHELDHDDHAAGNELGFWVVFRLDAEEQLLVELKQSTLAATLELSEIPSIAEALRRSASLTWVKRRVSPKPRVGAS